MKTFYLLSYLILTSCSLWAAAADFKLEAGVVDTDALKRLVPLPGSEIFSYEDNGHLHVRLQGVTAKGYRWSAADVNAGDLVFHQDLFADPEVMGNFGDGLPRPRVFTKEGDSNTEGRVRLWRGRFAAGQPHGGLTVFDINELRIGHAIAGGGDRAGTSEVAHAYTKGVWGQGLGKSVWGTVVHEWAPEVQRIGLGKGLQESDAPIATAFQCFGGKPLDQLDATASPVNVPSWKIALGLGFKAAHCGLDDKAEVIDILASGFEGKADNEIEDYRLMEAYVLETYFNEAAPRRVAGKRYVFIDHRENTWTLSKHARFDRLKFHFEYTVEG